MASAAHGEAHHAAAAWSGERARRTQAVAEPSGGRRVRRRRNATAAAAADEIKRRWSCAGENMSGGAQSRSGRRLALAESGGRG